jgi:predicted  nucleic acid-binding Zn-ribbon protein
MSGLESSKNSAGEIKMEDIDRERKTLRAEIEDLRSHADRLESDFENIARKRAALGYSKGLNK